MGAIKQNHQYLLILNAAFSLPEQSQPVNKHTPLCRDASINHLFVFVLFLTMFFFFSPFVFVCQQVLRRGQVFPKKQHDFVSNGLWGRSAEWELWDTGPIVGPRRQQQPAPHVTHEMDVLLHLEKRQASVCLPAILFKTPLSVPKDSIVNVKLFAPPTSPPQHWAVTNFDVQLCLLSWALYCLYVLWNLFQVCFLFL